ncbi:MAG: 50S ribosomal protein L11 methyltransferase [Oscillospiraceae bacterium]|jgi:ribosomal protein L11 methyltransferase|nr:50S ribosomal protein L11 methyltransferase [Oscillospiraceae bacterium]
MQWLEVNIRTDSAGIALLCEELTQAGFDSFIIDDYEDFHNFLEEAPDYWDYIDDALEAQMQGRSQVRLYLDAVSAQAQLSALRALLAQLPKKHPHCVFGELTIQLETLPDEDWAHSWQREYRPLPVGEKLLIVPQWLHLDDTQGRLPLYLDMGLAFGTGRDATTKLCLEALEAQIRGGERVLDLGSGSGILSLSALLLGCSFALGVDIDPAAARVSMQNAQHNHLDASFRAVTADILSDTSCVMGEYDIICANIAADTLIALAPLAAQFLRTGGSFLCSGILAGREDEVAAALQSAGLILRAHKRLEQWHCLCAEK